ncbi:MAG: hypothetical protein OXF20_08465 [Gammaproteobacteria bacterium]|nr:hypothetical protein [Gammaproteobacteria bacterium]
MNESINRGLDNRVRKVEEQNHELSERISVLEEKMNTSYERLRADMAKRENRLIITILGGLAVATTVLGLLIAGIPAA